jgi:hypothetical protein
MHVTGSADSAAPVNGSHGRTAEADTAELGLVSTLYKLSAVPPPATTALKGGDP